MFKSRNSKAVEELIDFAQQTLEDSGKVEETLAELPDIGEIPQFKEMLAKSRKGLRAALQAPVGGEMQTQVVQWLAMTCEAMLKAEEIRTRASLTKDRAAHAAALARIEMEYALQAALQVKSMVEKYAPLVGYDPEEFRLAFENYAKQSVALQLHKQFASQAGVELPTGFLGPLEGLESLLPAKWDPSRALGDGLEKDEISDQRIDGPDSEVIEGKFADSSPKSGGNDRK